MLFAQQEEISQEDLIYAILYETSKAPFGTPTYAYKLKDFDKAKLFAKSQNSSGVLQNALDYLAANAKIVQETRSSGMTLRVESHFPNGFDEDRILTVSEIDLKSANVKDATGKTIEVPNFSGGNMFGNEFKDVAGNPAESYNYRTFNMSNSTKYGQKTEGALSGEMTYVAMFLTDYAIVRLTAKDVGKQFELNGNQFKVIAVYDNKMVLDCLSGKAADFVSKLYAYNLKGGGKQICTGLDFEEYDEKGISMMDENLARRGKMSVAKDMFEIFRKNPEITFEEFKKIMPMEKLSKRDAKDQYLLINSIAPIDGELIIYEEIYNIQKEFTVGL